ncbi:MAG: hypothetical protein IKN17_10840 [Ruminococcus sp.]|nr:hypothetical protein [Ruminococcus sp.]
MIGYQMSNLIVELTKLEIELIRLKSSNKEAYTSITNNIDQLISRVSVLKQDLLGVNTDKTKT